MESVGELFKNLAVVKKALKEPATPTPAQDKLLDAAIPIKLDPAPVERAYMARQLVQCTLPHKNPGNVERWLRRNGNSSLVIQAGWDDKEDCSYGYPYGVLPRVLLFWVTTEAVLTKSRRLQLGHSLAEFMRELGLNPSRGGKRSDAKRLRDQMARLFHCRITFNERSSEDGAQGHRWRHMEVSADGEYWWDHKQPEQGALWESWIELGEKFFEAVTAAPVPTDMRALRALRRSPLALDLYAWATYRAFSVSRRGEGFFVQWDALLEQMGAEYKNVREFSRKVRAALRKVKTVYPALKFKNKPGGIEILPCPPSVPPVLTARA